jgi:Mn-dependent DtxR family transcriptional regulator
VPAVARPLLAPSQPDVSATWYHETISDLKRRGLVGEDDQGMPKLTEQGLALARTL